MFLCWCKDSRGLQVFQNVSHAYRTGSHRERLAAQCSFLYLKDRTIGFQSYSSDITTMHHVKICNQVDDFQLNDKDLHTALCNATQQMIVSNVDVNIWIEECTCTFTNVHVWWDFVTFLPNPDQIFTNSHLPGLSSAWTNCGSISKNYLFTSVVTAPQKSSDLSRLPKNERFHERSILVNDYSGLLPLYIYLKRHWVPRALAGWFITFMTWEK